MLSVIYLSAVCLIPSINNQELSSESHTTMELLSLENHDSESTSVTIPSNKNFVFEKIMPLQEANQNRGKIVLYNKLTLKPIVHELLQKISPAVITQGLHDKLEDIKQYWTHPNRPNFGGIQFASPEQIWEKLHEKGHNILTGINGAIFGLVGPVNHDYPFPYRSLNRRSVDN